MRSRFIALAAICAAGATGLASEAMNTASSNALAVFDAYLTHAAPTVSHYRTDLRPTGNSADKSPGRLQAPGPLIGAFTYRSKTYAELSRDERSELLRDPRFRAFLLALRTHADRAPMDFAEIERTSAPSVVLPARQSSRPPIEQFSISAEEMLQRRPMFVVLASP